DPSASSRSCLSSTRFIHDRSIERLLERAAELLQGSVWTPRSVRSTPCASLCTPGERQSASKHVDLVADLGHSKAVGFQKRRGSGSLGAEDGPAPHWCHRRSRRSVYRRRVSASVRPADCCRRSVRCRTAWPRNGRKKIRRARSV